MCNDSTEPPETQSGDVLGDKYSGSGQQHIFFNAAAVELYPSIFSSGRIVNYKTEHRWGGILRMPKLDTAV